MSRFGSFALVSLALLPAWAEAQSAAICAIQGTGTTPAFMGTRVVATGVVTAEFPAASPAGFFMQDPGCDADPNSSDGIWVSVGTRGLTAIVGHRVSVTGRVTNDFGLTAIEAESVSDGGVYAGSVEALTISSPADATAASAYLEAREGMLVALPRSRVVAATNHFGEAYLMPESSGVTRLFRGATDGRKIGIGAPGGWLALDHGDVVEAVGPLTWTFGQWKVLIGATRPASVQRGGMAAAAATPVAGALTLASYNLENFFDTVDDPGKDDADSTPSAAQYPVEVARRARSIARYLGSPDVVGVQEVEKIEVLQDLVADPELSPAGYRAVLVEGPDPRGIDVGLLYGSRLSLRSAEARQACTDIRPSTTTPPSCTLPSEGAGYALFARPPLVVRLTADDGERLVVIVNHFRAQDGDTATDDRLRLAQADAVRAIVAEVKAAESDAAVIVMGDLNDHEDSAPVARLRESLVDVHRLSSGRTYSYTYQGVADLLDYVLVDAPLQGRVADGRVHHVNVDFAAPGPGSGVDAGPHASDHDPVIVSLHRR